MNKNPDAIVGYDLKGSLFFGTTDHLYDAMMDDLKRATYIVLDMRRITQVDLTAVRLIEHMYGIMRQRDGELILAHVPKSMGLVKRHGHRHERLVPYHKNIHLRTFGDSDKALEYAENKLLQSQCHAKLERGGAIALAESELMASFNAHEKELLQPFFKMRDMRAKDYLFRSGEYGDALFVILSGEVEVLLSYGKKKRLRLAIFGPGMSVGEVAFLEPGLRLADGRALMPCRVAMFEHAALKQLCDKHSDIGIRLLLCLGHDVSENLRLADAKLRRLAA